MVKQTQQSPLYRLANCDFLVLSGSIKVTNPRTGQTVILGPGSHFTVPAKCPYALLALEQTHLFFSGSQVAIGAESVLVR